MKASRKPIRVFKDFLMLSQIQIFDLKTYNTWSEIDAVLDHNDFDRVPKDNSQPVWMDYDAGWKQTSIGISVPFNHHATVSGPKEYIVGNLYH